jgi:type III secretory pathway lipoprotein EscJ
MDALASADSSRRSARVTPAQVIALGLVAAAIGWAAWLLRDRPSNEEVELLAGTVLPSSELAIVEAAFDRAQLAGHRTEDGRIWVPRSRQSAYMRALVDAEALPREFGSSLRRALENNSPWQSRAAQEEVLRVAVQEELAHVICSMPGIERAAVLYDVDERGALAAGLGGVPTRTASVNVRTQPDTELEPTRVQAIRVLVAASIAGLAPERVAVTDLRSGRVHAGPLDAAESPAVTEAMVDPALARRIAHERHLAAKVRQGLSFVKGAVVDVTVTFAPPAAPQPAEPAEPLLPPRQQRVADANAPAEVVVADDGPREPVATPASRPAVEPAHLARSESSGVDAGPDSIVVSLAVPETWFETAFTAARQRDPLVVAAMVDRREEERLREHVLQLLPITPQPDARRIVITRFPVAAVRRDSAGTSRGAAPTAPAPATAAPPTVDRPQTLGGFVDATWQAFASGRFEEVPREFWMVLTAKCSALLAWILFRKGSHAEDAPSARRRGSDRRRGEGIDWSAMDEDAADEHGSGRGSPSTAPRRMAA